MLNPDTRVSVHCYSGDQHQVIHSLGLHLHHECPLVVMSPDDAPADIRYPGVENRLGGKRAYIGQASLDRQRDHLKMLLDYPESHFLLNDADSFCLDAKLPDYLYAEPDVVWSNQVNDDIPEHQSTFPAGWPHVAFQPPYFLSRKSIEAMLAVADQITASPVMPFIDYYMVQLTMTAGLPWKRFENCVSCAISYDPVTKPHPTAHELSVYNIGAQIGRNHVKKGANFIHSVKDHVTAQILVADRKAYLDSLQGKA